MTMLIKLFIRFSIASISIFFLLTCHKVSIYTIYLKNNSNLSFYYSATNMYPDTAVAPVNYAILVTPGMTQPIGINQYDGFSTFGGILEIFLIDSTVFKTNPWDSIVSKNLTLKKYDLTLDTLKKLNWTITYP